MPIQFRTSSGNVCSNVPVHMQSLLNQSIKRDFSLLCNRPIPFLSYSVDHLMNIFLSESNIDSYLSIAPDDDPDTYGCVPGSISRQGSSLESESSSPVVVYQQPGHRSAQAGPTGTSYCGGTNWPQYFSEACSYFRTTVTNEEGQGQADGLRWERSMTKPVSWYRVCGCSA